MPPDAPMPMRILMVAPTPFFADRGCHVRIYEQCRALKRAGHHVVLCTYHHGRDVDDVETRRSLRIPWYQRLSAGPSIHKFYIDLLLLGTVIRQCLRSRPDVIHAHLHEGVVIGRIAGALLRIPLIADLQGSLSAELAQHGFVRPGSRLHRLFAAAERLITRMPDAVLASSHGTLRSLPGEVAADPRAHVLPDGIDTAAFFPDSRGRAVVRRRLGIDDHTPVVGYLGVLTEYQGVDVLLRAVCHIIQNSSQHPRFLIMGYPDVERYQLQARELGIADHVIFTGRIPYDQARAHLSACDIAVSPKLSHTEANGKLLNYLAVGLPIVASETPTNREILHEAGLLTPPGDHIALADAVTRILADEQLARQLHSRAITRASHFCWSRIGNRLTRLYSELIRTAARPRQLHPAQS
jgi:glycosyltransferase involved in cell wall biosynthesis